VHDAWLRLNINRGARWQGRPHFFAAAAEAMRRILVENARRKRRLKSGSQLQRLDVDVAEIELPTPMPDDQLLALDEALELLCQANPQGAAMVKLCFFTGLTQGQAAKELGISLATAERLWSFARAWLFREMKRRS
jgi:RNA polymerase sigma factor (TIGR02999 family)